MLKYYCDNKRHLICIPYSVANLHIMANQLGIKRCWYHHGKFPHYDIPKTRVEEISDKCTIVPQQQILRMINEALDSDTENNLG